MSILERKNFISSPNLILRKINDNFIAYNSLLGFPSVINNQSMEFLDLFNKPQSLNEIKKNYSIEGGQKWLQFFITNHYLTPADYNERNNLKNVVADAIEKISEGKHLSSLGLILDEACNFKCSYCISKKMIKISGRSLPNKRRMTWPVAKKSIDEFINFVSERQQEKLEIYFGGSEPLLNWNLLKRVINYCLEHYSYKFKFSFSTNTNSSLITEERAKFLGQHKVTVTTSLDGPSAINDRIRRFISGKGTYNQVIKGWDNLSRFNQKIEWFCLTLTNQNIDEINEKFFDFLLARGITSCSFEPDIISPLHKPAEEVVDILLKFRHMGEDRGIIVGGLWDKPLKNMFESNVRKKLFNCSAFTGQGISVSPSGDILPCSYSATKFGKINDIGTMFQSNSYKSFISSRAIGNIEKCQGCEIEGQCMGGCYITPEYGYYSNDNEAFKYRCEIYKKITSDLLVTTVKQ